MDRNRREQLVIDAINRIGRMTNQQDLIQQFNNINRHPEISDEQRERLIAATERQLRIVAPAAATRAFGPRDTEGREYLQEVYDRLARDFDLSDNVVGNGVKTGGDMIAGRRSVDIYISYKRADGWHVSLGWLQDTAGSEAAIRILKYKGGMSNNETLTEEYFGVGERHVAAAAYEAKLIDLLRRTSQR